MAGTSTETLGAMARAAESLRAEAGAVDVMPESGAQRPVASEEQAAHPEMLQGVVGRCPRGIPPPRKGGKGGWTATVLAIVSVEP